MYCAHSKNEKIQILENPTLVIYENKYDVTVTTAFTLITAKPFLPCHL